MWRNRYTRKKRNKLRKVYLLSCEKREKKVINDPVMKPIVVNHIQIGIQHLLSNGNKLEKKFAKNLRKHFQKLIN